MLATGVGEETPCSQGEWGEKGSWTPWRTLTKHQRTRQKDEATEAGTCLQVFLTLHGSVYLLLSEVQRDCESSPSIKSVGICFNYEVSLKG